MGGKNARTPKGHISRLICYRVLAHCTCRGSCKCGIRWPYLSSMIDGLEWPTHKDFIFLPIKNIFWNVSNRSSILYEAECWLSQRCSL